MTKRDYNLIAGVLNSLSESAAHCFDDDHDRIAIASVFADALAETNPRFDRERFITAVWPIECENPNAAADGEECYCPIHRDNSLRLAY